MKRDFNILTEETFDLIVIGGGIIGTGIAYDAALRGLHTLLVEKEDFGYGTTSRTSRLIHGGLRYLRMLDFKLVRQDLKERETLLNIAPHLVQRLRFIIPLLRSAPLYRFALPIGMRLYDLLSAGKDLPSWQHLSLRETVELESCLSAVDGLVGSYLYYDCQAEFVERLCLENALAAAQNGACVLNHAAVTNLLIKDNTVSGVQVTDALSGEKHVAHTRMVLNAGGPWADIIWSTIDTGKMKMLRKTKGIHLLTSKISENALVLFTKSDGRLFFVIPWYDYSLIGTTDTDYSGDLDELYADKSDVEYLVSEIRNYFPSFKHDDIYYTQAGLRPLVANEKKAESNTSRAHKIIDHGQEHGIRGFISVMGGKITAYRAVAEEAVDLVCKKLKLRIPCSTPHTPLPGAPAVHTQEIEKAAEENSLPLETVDHLAAIYGSRFYSVLNYVSVDKHMGSPIASGCQDILAQIKHAVVEEAAMTVSDFMLRRSPLGLGPSQGLNSVEAVAREMGLLLGWSPAEIQKQMENYTASATLGQHFREQHVA